MSTQNKYMREMYMANVDYAKDITDGKISGKDETYSIDFSKKNVQDIYQYSYSYLNGTISSEGEDTINGEIIKNTTKLDLNGENVSSRTTEERKADILSSTNSFSDQLIFELPDWGIEDYINDRTRWQKGIRTIADEPGWFYFKVFFKFNTNFGLFGGIQKGMNGQQLARSTCALRYLSQVKTLYKNEMIPHRIEALKKFTRTLSLVNTKFPWMIKGVNGLDKCMTNMLNEFDKEKDIEIIFNTESTDMKIINMLNYYRYACFDDINCKEIIPENLRKFDMMVVLYHMPIKYFQTGLMVAPKRDISTGIMKPGTKLAKAEEIINKTFNFLTTKSSYYKYKRMSPDNGDMSNMMSFSMFTFNGCEFDVDSFGKYFDGSEMKNEQAFQFTETGIKIKYERVYHHTMNEWSKTLFGSDGFHLSTGELTVGNYNDNFDKRLKSIEEAKKGATFFDKNAEQYKAMIDYAESVITDGLISMDMKNYYAFLKGNMYGDVNIGSDYYNAKLKSLKPDGTGMFTGNLYGNVGLDSPYWKAKKEMLKEGSNYISGNLFGFDPTHAESDECYFSAKIKAMKNGTIKSMFPQEDYKNFLQTKMSNINSGTISGNLFKDNSQAKRKPNYRDEADAAAKLYESNQFTETSFNNFEEITKEKERHPDDLQYNNLEIKTQIIEERQKLTPTFTENQEAKQKTSIWNYLANVAGNSKMKKNKGLLGGVMDAANDMASFWKW